MAKPVEIEIRVVDKASDQIGRVGSELGSTATKARDMGAAAEAAGAGIDSIGAASGKVVSAVDKASQAFNRKKTAIEGALDVEQSEIELARQSINLQKVEQQGILSLAKARGDEAQAMQAGERLREIEIAQLAMTARSKRAEASAIEVATAARREALATAGPLTMAQQQSLQISENAAKALRTEAATADQAANQIRQLGVELQGAAAKGKALNTTISASTNSVEEAAQAFNLKKAAIEGALDVEKSEIELARQSINLQKVEQQGILSLAKARGDEAKAMQAGERLREIEVSQLSMTARSKRAEASAIEVATAARREALAAAGPLTRAQQQSLQISENAAKALRAEAATADQAASQIRQLGTELQGAAAKGKGLNTTLSTSANGLDDLSGKITSVGRGLAGLVGLNIGTGLIQDAAATADAYNNLAARIKLATGEGALFEQAMQAVQEISIRTSSSLEATGTLFARLQSAGQSAGQSAQAAQTNALALVETINQAVQLSGASAAASDAALTQLIQGLQSGVLRGEEFNSVMEQAPRLSQAMADGLGVTTGELLKMANEGRLTADVVMGALKSQADTLKTEFSTLPPTIGRAIQNLSTAWTVYVGEADKASGASAAAASAIDAVAKNLDTLAEVATRAGAVVVAAMAVQAVGALRAYIAQAAAAGAATSLLGLEMSKIPKMLQITVALAGFEAAYQLGTWLRETSQTAREFAVSFVDFVQAQVNSLQYLKEAGEAVFNDDTIGAAMDRYNARAAQQKSIIADMMKDAEQAPKAIEAAANAASIAGEKAEASAIGAGQAIDDATSKAKTLGVTAASAGTTASEGIGKIKPAADEAAAALLLLQEASKAKPQAMTSGIQLGLDLKKAAEEGRDLAVFLEAQLPAAVAKLSGPELEKFKTDFQVAMQVAGGEGKALEAGIRIIGERAAQSLGVDLVAASAQAGEAFKASQKDLDALISALPAMKAAGVDAGKVVGQAFSGMIGAAKNGAEIDELKKRIESLRDQMGKKVTDGLLSDLQKQAEKLGVTFDKLPEKAKSAAERTAQAFKDMGVQTKGELEKTALAFGQNYEIIKASGKATASALTEAFKKYADASIAANGGTASESIRAEAAMHGLEITTDRAGKTIVRSMSDGADSSRNFKDSVNEAKKSVEELAEAERQRLQIDKDGFTTDKSGGRLAMGGDLTTLTGIANFAKSAGLTDEQAKQIAREFSDGMGKIPYFSNPGQQKYGGDTISMAVLNAVERLTFGIGSQGAQPIGQTQKQQTGSSGGASSSSTVVEPMQSRGVSMTVNINGKPERFRAASQNDAQAIVRSLTEASRVSGRG